MALWFDKNRDGISQPGEVESLSSLGVVALYYKPNRTDQKSGDIQADLGFERLVNGKLVKGASVDWFSKTFSTRQEAMVALSAIFQDELDISDAAFAEAGMRSVCRRSAMILSSFPAPLQGPSRGSERLLVLDSQGKGRREPPRPVCPRARRARHYGLQHHRSAACEE